MKTIPGTIVLMLLAAAPAAAGAHKEKPGERLAREVRETETAFARSMADRDLSAFASHVAAEAIFISADRVLRGRNAIVEGWKRYFEGPDAPFSWRPGTIEILDSGTLALSSGPVTGADGRAAGTFNSIWRRDSDGRWRIIFDKGCPACGPP